MLILWLWDEGIRIDGSIGSYENSLGYRIFFLMVWYYLFTGATEGDLIWMSSKTIFYWIDDFRVFFYIAIDSLAIDLL